MDRHHLVVVGGGNAGISLAARLLRDGAPDVALVAAEPVHRYRPLLNYVGVGEAPMRRLERPMREVVPSGCTRVEDDVASVDADAGTLRTRQGREVAWSTLVLCPGMVEDWEATPGLRAAYDDGWAGSTFVVDSVEQVWPALRGLGEGRVVFTVPPEPAPCGATALKPLLMACDHWQRTGVLDRIEVHLVLPGESVTGLARADEVLERTLTSYGVRVTRHSRVASVEAGDGCVEVDGPAGRSTIRGVAYAHVVPHYRAPGWIADAGLADGSPAGLVDIDPETLRHRRHPSVWALGDAAAVATRPSGGALRHQVDVLARNLLAAATEQHLHRYDGYTVMPITTSRRRLMLVEVDRDGRETPSVPLVDLVRPRRSTWWFDRYALPVIYHRRILRGRV